MYKHSLTRNLLSVGQSGESEWWTWTPCKIFSPGFTTEMTGFYIWKRNKSKCDHIWTRLRHKWAVVNKMIIVPKNSMYTLSVVIVMSGLANMLIATITTWVNVTNHVSALKFSCKCILKTLFSLKLSSKTLWPASCGILMCADRPGSWRDWTSEWNKRERHVVIWNEDAGNIPT